MVRKPAEILSFTNHRQWDIPSGPWLMMQGWYNLLFAHWPVPKDDLRPLIPEPLALDTYEGSAWVSVTPFDLRLRPRGFPVLSHFPELNCRTYVVYGNKPGIYFFSLDAGSRLAVWGARTLYRLPYFHAKMTVREHNGFVDYSSSRDATRACFVAKYGSEGPVYRSQPGSLEHWLTERYCLYTHSGGRLFRGEIHHLPWPLQRASCEIFENSITMANRIALPQTQPLLHFAQELDVLIWPLKPASR